MGPWDTIQGAHVVGSPNGQHTPRNFFDVFMGCLLDIPDCLGHFEFDGVPRFSGEYI